MKTFEEKFTAWIDGQLTGKELVEFEASLPDKAAAELEKEQAHKLGVFLKEQLGAHSMTNEEFFHHQLREQIDHEENIGAGAPSRRSGETWWTIGRLLWTGAASLAVFIVCTFFIMRDEKVGGQSPLLSQVLGARVDSPNADISIFETKEHKVTVLWVNGLESLPSEYAAQ
ncbi:MAG: hypothetical protein M3119_03440 [Verrucomicrobiota bacterium]|nr:hypothetical protein [Verrucomicrobiota bacterium]MDQ6939190.1 hypothetical protein [Verrucomicrobiota bacterium]